MGNEYEKLQQLVDQTLSMSEKEFMDLLPAKLKWERKLKSTL